MSEHTAVISWNRRGAKFVDQKYSRAHQWTFDGGAVVPASASPHIVPLQFADPAGVDPEEAYVAALSSCHMLWFLHIAARRGHAVESYRDHAVGIMAKNAEGKIVITDVELRPHTVFADEVPEDAVAAMHEQAHDECFIANSVKTRVTTTPTFEIAAIRSASS